MSLVVWVCETFVFSLGVFNSVRFISNKYYIEPGIYLVPVPEHTIKFGFGSFEQFN